MSNIKIIAPKESKKTYAYQEVPYGFFVALANIDGRGERDCLFIKSYGLFFQADNPYKSWHVSSNSWLKNIRPVDVTISYEEQK